MRQLFWTILAGCVCAASAPVAPAQTPAQTQAAVRQQLLNNENGWAAALVKRDGAYFRATLAPGFVYTENDKLSTRDEVLRDAISPGDTVTASHNEDMIVHLFGSSTGVVTGLLVVEGRAAGKLYVHRYRFTDTWVKQRDGRWQIVAAEDYLKPSTGR